MFVPRSARRIRFARATFVLAAVLPAAAIVTWAVYRHSDGHRDAVLHAWEQALGLPLAATAVEHPLPGTVRVRGCTLAAADGTAVVGVDTVAVETSPAEVRLTIGALDCSPAGAALLAGLAGDWLRRGARFRRDLVIDVAAFAWDVPGAAGGAGRRFLGPVRIECVAQHGARAVRIVRRDADAGDDEVRIAWFAGDGADAVGGGRLEVDATCTEPLPVAILAAVTDCGIVGLPCGASATVWGRVSAAREAGRWRGTASGRVVGVDLAACTTMLPGGADGTMNIDATRIEWRDGRLTACACACDASAGRVARRLIDALVATLGCRAGPGYLGAPADRERGFDAAGCEVRIDGRGIEVRGSPRLGGALAIVDGRPLLEPPSGIVSPERLAWLLAPPGAVYVPSSGSGAWLMSVLPRGGDPVERTSRGEAGDAGGGF